MCSIPVFSRSLQTYAFFVVLFAVTVVGMVEALAAPAGSYVVQTAAGSTLGRQFITVARLRGLRTINIVRRAEQVAELKALGADHVLNSEEVSMATLSSLRIIVI